MSHKTILHTIHIHIAQQSLPLMRIVILPGNGCSNVRRSNWYGWLENRLIKERHFDEVILKDMPDPVRARRSFWLPYIEKELLVGKDTIIIGHSSGAVAAMRLSETTKLAGLVLVAACHTDLGEPSEQQAGYYPPSGGPWKWNDIYKNAGDGNVILLHSFDDPFIPMTEARHVASSLGNAELREFDDESHFFKPSETIVQAVYDVLNASNVEL